MKIAGCNFPYFPVTPMGSIKLSYKAENNYKIKKNLQHLRIII